MARLRTVACLALALSFFALAARQQADLSTRRAALFSEPVEVLRNAPPLLAFNTVVLGGFRGLIADILWLRLSYLQDEGRYIELVQLADWITKLEPRASQIWAFHAWNMAYNVSIMMPTPADRWRWVRNGIELLRDEGIPLNPGDRRLYQELAWTFQHKIAGRSDTAHPYYQAQWRDIMTELVGGPHPDWALFVADPQAAQRLHDTVRLDATVMEKIDNTYGPLDWTSADAQAVYWAFAGKSGARVEEVLGCDRMILRSLARAFLGDTDRPDLTLLPYLLRSLDEAMARHNDHPTLVNLYRNFLAAAVYRLHQADEEAEARDLFDRLRQRFGLPPPIATFNDLIKAFEREDRNQ